MKTIQKPWTDEEIHKAASRAVGSYDEFAYEYAQLVQENGERFNEIDCMSDFVMDHAAFLQHPPTAQEKEFCLDVAQKLGGEKLVKKLAKYFK